MLRLPFSRLTLRLFAGLLLFIWVAGALLIFEQSAIRVLCGSILYFLLPGYFLTVALLPEKDKLEQITLAMASSTALSTLTILAVVLFVPGMLTLIKVWSALAILTALFFCVALYVALHGDNHTPSAPFNPAGKAPRAWWLLLLLLLLLAATLRLMHLDHAELQDDEIDIANVAVRILRGEEQVVFQDRRGPAQSVITAVAYALGERPREWILRLPVVISALATLAALIVLASQLFNRWLGLLSGLLFSLDGFVFAYGRIVQMQSTLLLMMVVAVLCFYQFYRSHTPKDTLIYQLLGTLFFGFGILAHYEMILLAPLLLFLYFAKYGGSFWQRNRLGLLLALGILLLTTASFYLAFILNPAFNETYAYYRYDIVGDSIRDSIHDKAMQFVQVALFYNSLYLFAALYIGAAIALLVQLRLYFRLYFPNVSSLTFLLGSFIFLLIVALPASLLNGEWRNNILLAGALLVTAFCVIPQRLPLAMRLLFLWFAIYFVLYLFVLDEVHLHYYAFSPPLAILAAWGWQWLYQRSAAKGITRSLALIQSQRQLPRQLLILWTGSGIAITILSIYYLWLVFVQPMPEYALSFPTYKHPLYPTPYTQRHGEAFGFPHRSGWRTIAWLYRNGILRGSFETNELWLKAQWYTQWQNAGEQPRYYLIADLPHRLQASPWPPPFVADEYHLWGVVTVRQQPRLHIYERNDFAPPAKISYWADEEMAAKLEEVQSIAELYRSEQYQADPAFYAQAAQRLAKEPEAALLFYAPEQSAIFSLYDQSNRRYYLPGMATGANLQARSELLNQMIGKERTLYALYWGVDELPWPENLHTWLNQQLFPVSDEWIGNLRLVYYDVPQTSRAGTQEAAAIEERREITLGTAIQLEGFTVQREKNLHLSLFWRALAPVPERYKVFVHLLDATNAIVSQQDGEPVGGQRPTDTWAVGEADGQRVIQDNHAIPLPSDIQELKEYKLAVGMYNPLTGERLPMYGEDGTQLPNDMLLINLD